LRNASGQFIRIKWVKGPFPVDHRAASAGIEGSLKTKTPEKTSPGFCIIQD
jgi:hypothetical protein